MHIDTVTESEVHSIALGKVCEHIDSEEWCEDGSVRMDIKELKVSDGINSSAIEMLLERVKVLEKEVEKL